jgi:lysophospholipase L1-like esterase
MFHAPGVMSVIRKFAVVLFMALWAGWAVSAQAAGGDWYLALGDSLAAGYQSQPSVAGGGYVDQLTGLMQPADPGMQLMNLAVPGETTSSFLGSQLSGAEAFLHGHQGHVRLVTIDIGGNDIAGCPPGDTACLDSALTRIDGNVSQIVSGLTAAAGPETTFVMMTYYDPFLEYWVTGALGRAEAEATLPAVAELNRRLVLDFGPRFLVADVAGAFSTSDSSTIVSTPTHGELPMNVAVICRLTGGCDSGFNVHANGRGHLLMADTFLAAIEHRPPHPAPLVAPGVSGKAVPGATLTASHGVWANTPTTLTYGWVRCNVVGAQCSPIAGAAAGTYAVTAADRAHTIRVLESAVNAHGSGRSASHTTTLVPASVVQIKRQLAADIVPHGKQPKIAAILAAGGFTVSLTAFAAGAEVVDWYAVPPGQHVARLIAAGKTRFSGPGIRRVKLTLAPGSRRILGRVKSIRIFAAGSFRSVGSRGLLPGKASFVLKR